jgi:hypothetical protein
MSEQPECCTRYADAVFVFGSNAPGGRHGKGAALHAVKAHGAEYGNGYGVQNWPCYGRPGKRSYAIPTKDASLRSSPLSQIREHVAQFLHHARSLPETPFYVTALGTGLAGYRHEDIAPMFKDAPLNCILPREWEPWTRPNASESRDYVDASGAGATCVPPAVAHPDPRAWECACGGVMPWRYDVCGECGQMVRGDSAATPLYAAPQPAPEPTQDA